MSQHATYKRNSREIVVLKKPPQVQHIVTDFQISICFIKFLADPIIPRLPRNYDRETDMH